MTDGLPVYPPDSSSYMQLKRGVVNGTLTVIHTSSELVGYNELIYTKEKNDLICTKERSAIWWFYTAQMITLLCSKGVTLAFVTDMKSDGLCMICQ